MSPKGGATKPVVSATTRPGWSAAAGCPRCCCCWVGPARTDKKPEVAASPARNALSGQRTAGLRTCFGARDAVERAHLADGDVEAPAMRAGRQRLACTLGGPHEAPPPPQPSAALHTCSPVPRCLLHFCKRDELSSTARFLCVVRSGWRGRLHRCQGRSKRPGTLTLAVPRLPLPACCRWVGNQVGEPPRGHSLLAHARQHIPGRALAGLELCRGAVHVQVFRRRICASLRSDHGYRANNRCRAAAAPSPRLCDSKATSSRSHLHRGTMSCAPHASLGATTRRRVRQQRWRVAGTNRSHGGKSASASC